MLKQIEVKFNKDIYKKEAIVTSINEFSQAATFSLSEEEKYYLVSIAEIPAEIVSDIENEFCNYVLFLMKV